MWQKVRPQEINRVYLGYSICVFYGDNDTWHFWIFAPNAVELLTGTAPSFTEADLRADELVNQHYKETEAQRQVTLEEMGLPYIVNINWSKP